MIKEFKHKGLERFFVSGSNAGVQAKHLSRQRLILARLHAAKEPEDEPKNTLQYFEWSCGH